MDDDGDDDDEPVKRKKWPHAIHRLRLRLVWGGSSDQFLYLPKYTWRRPNPVATESCCCFCLPSPMSSLTRYELSASCIPFDLLKIVQASSASTTHFQAGFNQRRKKFKERKRSMHKHRQNIQRRAEVGVYVKALISVWCIYQFVNGFNN